MSERVRPMREPTYLVLASLYEGPLHGYGIIKRTGELSAGRVRLVTGTLYTALDRLIRDGYVSVVSKEGVAGHVRRRYGLTGTGHSLLRAEAARIGQAAREVSATGWPPRVRDIVVVGGRLRIGGKDRTR
jgi:DNA-binding PadR family transcriptional regulator